MGKINTRLLAIVTVVALLVGWPVYSLVQAQASHGIQKNGDRLDVDLKALGCFKFDEKTGTLADVPPHYRDLDGKEVALEGFAYCPANAGGSVNHFQFVYNINKCCIGGPPQVQERVFASVPGDGINPPPQDVEFRIIGKLRVHVDKDEVGVVRKVYTMNVEHMERL